MAADMRVLLVDDEQAARRRLRIMLEELDVEVVGEAQNGLHALELIGEHRPDVLLLDIAMPEVDGFDVARALSDPKPLVIFQTAYDDYALQAFEHEAIDYLVKPVTLERLERALDRARERGRAASGTDLTDEVLLRLQRTLRSGPVQHPRVLVRHGGAHKLISYDDVLLFYAQNGIVHARTAKGRFLTDYTLTELEERTGAVFLRPNRAELINMNHVTSIASNGDGSAALTLSDHTIVRVTRRRASAIRAQLKG